MVLCSEFKAPVFASLVQNVFCLFSDKKSVTSQNTSKGNQIFEDKENINYVHDSSLFVP